MHSLPRKIFYNHCFQFPQGITVKRNSKQCLLKILWSKQDTRDVQMANEPGAQINFRKHARRRIRVASSEALWPKMKAGHRKPR